MRLTCAQVETDSCVGSIAEDECREARMQKATQRPFEAKLVDKCDPDTGDPKEAVTLKT